MQQSARQNAGQFIQADFFANVDGLNLTDSFFAVKAGASTGGYNFDYTRTGGFKKTMAPLRISDTPNAESLSRGFDLYNTKTDVKQVMRYARSSWQSLDTNTGVTANLSLDTLIGETTVFSGATQVVSTMTTSVSTDILWAAGGGLDKITGAYSTTKLTENGSTPPAGDLTAIPFGGGGSLAIGTYWYAVALHKASTGALSNATLDTFATVTGTAMVAVDLTMITGTDTTKYDQIYLYRSAVNGSEGFTAGALVAIIPIAVTAYIDDGSNFSSTEVVPRSGSATLDNGELPNGTYEVIATFKRRLATANGSTLYFSDLNKFESWPAQNSITVPSGGKITGLVTIGYNHPGSGVTDEFLAVFKGSELWMIQGTSEQDWELIFVDYIGCPNQQLVVNANGILFWVNSRGVYLWDGTGKPIYASRPIEYIFGPNGSIDKPMLSNGSGAYADGENQVIWYLSDGLVGYQQYVLKMDTRLTLPKISNVLGQRVMDGVFVQGKRTANIMTGRMVRNPAGTNLNSLVLLGDNSGFIYKDLQSTLGTGNDVSFSYETAHIDCDSPGQAKRFLKVIAWVDKIGDYDLTLDYWANYQTQDSQASQKTQSITSNGITGGVWDVGLWDVMYWDGPTASLTPIVFNLDNSAGNAEGDAIKLRFSNNITGNAISVSGFSIVYTSISLRK